MTENMASPSDTVLQWRTAEDMSVGRSFERNEKNQSESLNHGNSQP
jgi:hypothetical protein